MTDKEQEIRRQLNLAKMEQHYADRMLVLVEDMKLASAQAIMQECTYTGDQEECDLLLDDLTDWLDNPFPGTDLRFYDKE